MMAVDPLSWTVQADTANSCKGAVAKNYGAERMQGVGNAELNTSEPLMTCRDKVPESENRREGVLTGTNSAEKKNLQKAQSPPAQKRQHCITGVNTELGILLC